MSDDIIFDLYKYDPEEQPPTIVFKAIKEIESLRQQLAAVLAACKQKDESLEAAHNGLRWWMDAFPLHVTEADNEEMLKIVKALAIQPDDSALKAWLEMSNTADCRSQSSLQGVVK